MTDEVLTQEEVEALILATIRGHERNGRGATEEDIRIVADWASEVRTDAALLRLLVDGDAVVTSVQDDGDFTVALREAES